MFHVKHCPAELPSTCHPQPLWKTWQYKWPFDAVDPGESPTLFTASFSDAEVPENNVENIVNVDAASEAAQGVRGKP